MGSLPGKAWQGRSGLKPGDTVVLVASTTEGSMNSVDFELGPASFRASPRNTMRAAVKIPLAAAQELFGSRGANLLVVELAATRDTEKVAEALRAPLAAAGLELRTWRELSDFYDKTVRFYDRQFGVLRLIVMFMVLLTVVNSVNMSLFERVAEFGTMRALGDRGSRIFTLVVVEGLVFGVLGAIVGVVLGIALALLLSAVGIRCRHRRTPTSATLPRSGWCLR
jgi:putative ABC transport system permease protein